MFLNILTDFFGKQEVLTICIYSVLVVIISTAYWYLSVPKHIPPGPIGLPIIGYLPFLDKKPYKTFRQLGKKYGKVFSVYMGSRLVIVLNDYEAIKEALIKQGDIFSGRPDSMTFNIKPKDNLSLSTTDGPFWKDHRRFALHTLRDLGLGKTSIEPQILEEVQCFLSELRKSNGKCKNIRNILGLSVCNNICILIFGKRFDYGSEFILTLKQLLDEFTTVANNVAIRVFFPWLRFIPAINVITKQKKFEQIFTTVDKAMAKLAEEKEKTHIEGSRGDYVDAYLTQIKSENTKDTIFKKVPMIHNMRMLFGAGTETTSNSLMFSITHMMNYPDVQRKVQEEIDAVMGSDRLPSWNDRSRTPYTLAVLTEVQRMISLAPLSLAHRNMEETSLFGHRIPKDSYVIPNLWNAHHDPELWDNPEEFRPERFLSESGQVVKPEYLIPFGTGKRQCLGESLAMMEMYLYFTSMLQQFTFKSPTVQPPSLDARMGLIMTPVNFDTCAIPRKLS